MKIQFQGKITAKDLRKGLYLNLQKRRLWGSLFLVFLVSFSYIFIALTHPEIYHAVGLAILFPIMIFSVYLWMPLVQANTVNQKGSFYYNPVHGEISDTEIVVDNGMTKGTILWQAYTHYQKSTNIVVLNQGKMGVNVFTRELFQSEDDWNSFVNLVSSKLPFGKSK